MIHPVIGVTAVVVALAGLIVLVRRLQRCCGLHPELSRKSVHVVMGLACLAFPWLFHQAWPVWAVAVLAMAALTSLRTVPLLKERFGCVLSGVDRQSWGDLSFPLSIAFVFTLSGGDPVRYCIPILVMTLADAVAAIIGRRYGAARYQTDDGWKTVEGSVAFLVVTFLSVHVPLLLATNIGRLESVLAAAVLGLVVMLMEAISWRGLDNLFVPIVSYVCLVRMMRLDVPSLVLRLGILALFVIGWLWWRRRTRLTPSAAIAAGLVLYVAWAVGDWNWLIAPLATAAGYTILCRLPVTRPRPHSVHAIAAIGGVGLCWLALAQILGTVNTIFAYGVGYAAHLAMIALGRFADERLHHPLSVAIVKAVLLGFLFVALPYWIIWQGNAHAVALMSGAAVLVLATVLVFALSQPSLRDCPVDTERLVRQALISAAASAGAFAVISKLEPWSTSFQ